MPFPESHRGSWGPGLSLTMAWTPLLQSAPHPAAARDPLRSPAWLPRCCSYSRWLGVAPHPPVGVPVL